MRKAAFGTAAKGQRKALNDLCAGRLQDYNLLIASNRGPVEFYLEDGEVRHRRGQGGLVTAVSSMVEVTPATWVASTMSPVDMQMAEAHGGRVVMDLHGHPLAVTFVQPTVHQYGQYYDQVANSVLWFLQHNITNPPIHPTFDQGLWAAWDEGYVKVNALFADRLAVEAMQSDKPPIFMIHDYHLYLVPGMLRARFPNALIQHFTHISWPSPDQWRQLPGPIREAIFTNLLGCDVVGFHCPRYAFNFLLCCQELLGAEVDWTNRTVRHEGRDVRVNDYPISIDPDSLREFAESPDVLKAEQVLMQNRPPHMILQVARTDPSKNILRSFYAYEQFLADYPDMHGCVQFMALLPSSRQTTELYKEYLEELRQVITRINEDYGRPDWQPIELHLENNYARGIAAMKHYDILLVNSIADGMNLVAKEGPIVNRKDGVLILSESAGAWDELGDSAIVINPFDLMGTSRAFYDALTMDRADRADALAATRESIRRNTIFRWAHDQLKDLIPASRTAKPGQITLLPPSGAAVPHSVESEVSS
jgi:trehalose 6-phosphate synthase